jgi:hypothetical protein
MILFPCILYCQNFSGLDCEDFFEGYAMERRFGFIERKAWRLSYNTGDTYVETAGSTLSQGQPNLPSQLIVRKNDQVSSLYEGIDPTCLPAGTLIQLCISPDLLFLLHYP